MSNRIIAIPPEEIERQRAIADAFAARADRPETYYIVTYGCQMNAHDSEKLAGMLEAMGLHEAEDKTKADFVLHNTCCIRDNAERKALGNVTWLKEVRKQRPEMIIGVCGCMVQEPGMAEKLLRQYPFVDLAFGTGNQYALPELLTRAVETRRRVVQVEADESTIAENVPIRRKSDIQAYVTIMYGCNNYCSYCIVPYVRGRERSRAADDILREVDGLVNSGTKEIMLLGQNVNSYGVSGSDGVTFAKLLSRVAESGVPRIRFMTSHPKDLSDELIQVMAEHKNILRHFHLPVQSGNDRILKEMNRHYTREIYLERLLSLRKAMPDIGVTTDLICAFPGETDAEFEDTLSIMRAARYDSAFTFIYSPRVGTRAALMPNQIPPEVATERIERMIALQDGVTSESYPSLIGQKVNVLVTDRSRRSDQMVTGKCERNISVNFKGDERDIGKIVPVRLTGVSKTTLRGERIQAEAAV
ncbi:MAG: tRNA (N6-isopentenyl adenosine(37)-C2)-methylthiotransferase MiaB [Clostridia bacterium]|nr:tRNA (N6-isopentenyl adenosine(37)-C2)-methylthiotransferase MiaB [Clostridia bacterium]